MPRKACLVDIAQCPIFRGERNRTELSHWPCSLLCSLLKQEEPWGGRLPDFGIWTCLPPAPLWFSCGFSFPGTRWAVMCVQHWPAAVALEDAHGLCGWSLLWCFHGVWGLKSAPSSGHVSSFPFQSFYESPWRKERIQAASQDHTDPLSPCFSQRSRRQNTREWVPVIHWSWIVLKCVLQNKWAENSTKILSFVFLKMLKWWWVTSAQDVL